MEGGAYRCDSADCSTATELGFLTLGFVSVGTLVTISMIWDPANDLFTFQLGANAPVNLPYAWSDTNPPSFVFKRLDVANTVPNCTAPPRPFAFMSARYDDVYVNASAAAAVARGLRNRGNNLSYDVAPR